MPALFGPCCECPAHCHMAMGRMLGALVRQKVVDLSCTMQIESLNFAQARQNQTSGCLPECLNYHLEVLNVASGEAGSGHE